MNFALSELFSDFAASSWRGAWLILALVALRVLVRGRIPAGVWFVAWIVVAIRLLLPFSVPVSWSPYNLTAARAPAALAPTRLELPPSPLLSVEPASAVPVSLESTPPLRGTSPAMDWRGPVALAWLGGMAAVLGARAMASCRLRRELRRAPAADARIVAIAQREAARWGIRGAVACRETNAVDAPALFGLWRPQLLFPPSFALHLTDDELRLVVRHELAHWRRRDLLAQSLMQAAVALHWFNPLAWLAARLARADCELACDEFVLRREAADGSSAYGHALLKVLSVVRGRRRPASVVAILEGKQQLAHRVRMIAGYRASTAGRVLGGVLLLAVLAGASVTRESHAQPASSVTTTAPISAAVEPPAPVSAPTPADDAALEQRERNRRQSRAVEMLAASVDEQRKKVDALAHRLQSFKEKHQMRSFDHRQDIINESLKTANLEAQRAYIQLETAKSRVAQIEQCRARGAELTGLSFVSGQPLVIELMQQIARQRIAVAKLNETYREAHPNMVAAKNVLQQTQHELERAVKSVCDQIEFELRNAETTHQARQRDLEQYEAASSDFSRLSLEYRQIEREFLTQNQILQNIVSRAREDMNMYVDRGRKTTLTPAAEPNSDSSAPKPKTEPLSVILQKHPKGWVITETRGDQDELAKSADQIEALKASLVETPTKVVSAPEAARQRDPDEFTVSVVGAVNAQGAVPLREGHKPLVLDAIARAGGFAPNADRAAVRLLRADANGVRATTVLSEDMLMSGKDILQRNDVVVVPTLVVRSRQSVNVLGAVNRPGVVEMPIDRNLTIVDVISLAGGPSRLADLRRVRLTRVDPHTRATTLREINVDEMLKGKDDKAAVEPGDVIFIAERIM